MMTVAYFTGLPIGGVNTNLDLDPSLEEYPFVINSHVSDSFNVYLGTTFISPFPELLTMKFARTCSAMTFLGENLIHNSLKFIVHFTILPDSSDFL